MVVVEVSAAAWVHTIAGAWREIVHNEPAMPKPPPGRGSWGTMSRIVPRDRVLEFRRDGSEKKPPDDDSAAIGGAAVRGTPVYGVSHSLALLPRDLVRAAEGIVIPTPTRSSLPGLRKR